VPGTKVPGTGSDVEAKVDQLGARLARVEQALARLSGE
jgi:hypothetical protein